MAGSPAMAGPPRGSLLTSSASRTASSPSVLQDEATKTQSVSGLPMFGDRFPD
jgi:hypothetical protein